jgi:adenosine deaminase
MNPNIREIISKMPKAELHLHLEGTPKWSSIRQALAKHYGRELPEIPNFYHPDFQFRDFQEFLDTFVAYIHPWLRTSDGYAEFIDAAVEHIIGQNICYVELNFSIFNIERMGHQLEPVLFLLAQAVKKLKPKDV